MRCKIIRKRKTWTKALQPWSRHDAWWLPRYSKNSEATRTAV